MLSCIKEFFQGIHGGLEKMDIDLTRQKFSDLLPWVSYDEETKHYFLKDGSVGWIWECNPVLFAGDSIFDTISSLLRSQMPHHTVFQFMLYADSYINEIVYAYKDLRDTAKEDLYKEVTENYTNFLNDGLKGMWQLSGTPLRNFRLFISIKVPVKSDVSNIKSYLAEIQKYSDVISNVAEGFKSLNPKPLKPDMLITSMYRLCNPELNPDRYQNHVDEMPICKQIIFADTEIEKQKYSIRFGNKFFGVITPKKLPRNIDNMFANDLAGFITRGATAIENDINQIQCPYVFTVNIITDSNLRSKLGAKALHNSTTARGAAKEGNMDSMMVSTGNRREENMWVANQYEEGNTFLHIIPQLMLICDSEEDLTAKLNRTKAFWNTCGVETQSELEYMLHVLFVSALPCGLYSKVINEMERNFIVDTNAAALSAPIQAAFKGVGEPVLLYIDRRGQPVTLDIFNTGKNKNFYVTGGTGAGKSFFMNDFTNSYRSIDSRFRIITVCDSYRKTCYLSDGQYIEHEEEGMIINFFSEAGTMFGMLTEGVGYGDIMLAPGSIVEVAEISESFCKIVVKVGEHEEVLVIPPQQFRNLHYELDGDTLNMLTGIIASMASSRTGEMLGEDEVVILETAIRAVYARKNRDTNIDDLLDYLNSMNSNTDLRAQFHVQTAYKLMLRLEKYSSKGTYGKYFNGKSTISMKKDMVVVDLTKTPEDLRKVFVLAFANIIEQEIYKGDRKKQQFVVLDESWQTLSENPYAKRFVEGLYRKARKYNASVGIITQSLDDLHEKGKLGLLGDVITSQSDFSFALYDENFRKAKDLGVLKVTDFEFINLIEKIPKDALPRYSEIFVRTPHGNTIVRLIVDEYKYFLNTSDPKDYLFIREQVEKFINKGFSKKEAMRDAVKYCAELAKQLGGIGAFKKYLLQHKGAGDETGVRHDS